MDEGNGKVDGNGQIGSGSTAETQGDVVQLTRKDFVSDQDVRWCPGCGDYAILAVVQAFMPELGVPKEDIVFVSGIGCSSRFPYYMNTYGLHGIHGRAPAIASGVAIARPDLQVWVVTGDGDGLSIGGNHLIHTLRRNVNLKILLFNNEVYGLTKGQYSPTSRTGMVTKSTPFGSIERAFNPISLALGAEASFVARTLDGDRKHLTEVLRAMAQHKGTAFVEIYQNCNVYNDGAFDVLRGRGGKGQNWVQITHGEKILFGENKEKGIVFENGSAKIVEVADVGMDQIATHDIHTEDPSLAFALSRISQNPTGPTPMGIFRSAERPTYEEGVERQIKGHIERSGEGELSKLLHGGDTWIAPDRRKDQDSSFPGPDRRTS